MEMCDISSDFPLLGKFKIYHTLLVAVVTLQNVHADVSWDVYKTWTRASVGTYTKHGPGRQLGRIQNMGPGSMDHPMDPVHGPPWTTPWTRSMDHHGPPHAPGPWTRSMDHP